MADQDPVHQGGGTPKPFTYLPERFLPKLADAGTIERLMRHNPFIAFAR